MEPYTDDQLIDGILHSNPAVLNYIYSRYFGKVENFLIGKGGNSEHIKDVFQEAMYVIFQKITEKGLILTCSFSTYLFAVCKNIWMHDLRKNRYHPIEESNLDILLDEPVQEDEMQEKLKELFYFHLSKLSEDCQKLLNLHFNRVSLADIQQIFGYSSEHYTSDRKYRCKQSLYTRILKDPKYKEILRNG